MSNRLPENGMVELAVAASDKLVAYSRSPFKVYVKAGYPNFPDSWTLLSAVAAYTEYLSSAFSAAGRVRIEAGADDVLYQAGTAPVITERRGIKAQGALTAMTTSASITAAGILSGVITGTHAAGATQNYTLPTGALMDAAFEMAIGESLDWALLNLSAAALDTITILQAGADHTIVGNPIVQSAHVSTGGVYGNSAMFRTRKTAADTFITYRIA